MQTVEEVVVQKVLRTFPSIFDSKVSVLEDRTNLDKLIKDELYEILTTYEMRAKKENGSKKEASFKATRKYKNNKHECKNSSDMYDEEDPNFVRNLKRG